MIDIEYRHSEAELEDPTIRRRSTGAMVSYIRDLIFEMQMADISCKFTETICDGPNTVLINKMTIPEIIEGLEIKLLDVAPIFARAISHIHGGTSIADLF